MGALTEDLMFGADDAQMLDHIVDVIGDRMHSEDGYTEADEATLKRLERLRDACRTQDLVCVVMVAVTAEMMPQPEEGADDDAYECRDAAGNAHPEHDYGTTDCRRCGAESA